MAHTAAQPFDPTPNCLQACAYGDDMGKYATRVVRTEWLRNPVPMRGQAGLFEVQVPQSAIPQGWSLDTSAERESEADIVFEFEV